MAENEDNAAAGPAKKGKGKLLLILAAVLVAAGGGAGAFFLRGASDGDPAHEEKADPGVISLASFVTNLADEDGERYIKCTMRLEIDERELAEHIKLDELAITRIRDRILTILSGKTFDEVASGEGKERLKQDIREQVDLLLEGGTVTDVYYSEFIVQ